MPSICPLKEIRKRQGLSIRKVEDLSRMIAEAEGNEGFYISNGWLTRLENGKSIPSIHKLFSLSVIYSKKFTDLLNLCGVDIDKISKYQMEIQAPNTHLLDLDVYEERLVHIPLRFSSEFKTRNTSLISPVTAMWEEVPLSILQHLDLRRSQYGFIGLEDYMMYPLIRPGSFVKIDARQKKIKSFQWRTEFDRPIYFIELREGYACCWCELEERILTLVPHPLSPNHTRKFVYRQDAEIAGLVTAVAMRIVD